MRQRELVRIYIGCWWRDRSRLSQLLIAAALAPLVAALASASWLAATSRYVDLDVDLLRQVVAFQGLLPGLIASTTLSGLIPPALRGAGYRSDAAEVGMITAVYVALFVYMVTWPLVNGGAILLTAVSHGLINARFEQPREPVAGGGRAQPYA